MKVEGNETLTIRGTLDASGGTLTLKDDQISRAKLTEESLAEETVAFTEMRVHDNLTALLPQAAATDDLGLIDTTFGTDSPTLQTSDAKATTVTQYARFAVTVDNSFVTQADFQLRVRGGMITTISDGTATVDLEVYLNDGDGAAGSDLCTTAAQSINSLTKASRDFVITTTGVSLGDVLDCRLTVAITDSATGTAVIGEISKVSKLRDIKG